MYLKLVTFFLILLYLIFNLLKSLKYIKGEIVGIQGIFAQMKIEILYQII